MDLLLLLIYGANILHFLSIFLLFLTPLLSLLLLVWKKSEVIKGIYTLLMLSILAGCNAILLEMYTLTLPSFDYPSWDYLQAYVILLTVLAWLIYLVYFIRKSKSFNEFFREDLQNFIEKFDEILSYISRYGSIIFLAWSLFAVMLLLWRFGVFSTGIIKTIDHPYHYYQAWYTAKYLLPYFHTLVGWNPYFYAGYPFMYHYYPGGALIISIIHLGSLGLISLSLAYRMLLASAVLVTPLSTYFLAREFNSNKTTSVVIGLLAVIPSNMYMHTLFLGISTSILATGISPFVFLFLHKYVKTKKIQHILLSSVIFAAIILIHSIIAIGVASGIILYILLHRNLSPTVFASLVILPFLLSAFWMIPSVLYFLNGYGSLTQIIPVMMVKTFSGFINYHLFVIFGLPIVLWPFIISAYKKHHQSEVIPINFLLYYPPLIYLISFYGAAVPEVKELQLLHLAPYLGLYLSVVAGWSISKALEGKQRRLASLALLMAVTLPPMSILTTPFHPSLVNEKTVLSVDSPPETTDVFNWVKENSKGRVLLETSDALLSEKPWGFGWNTALAPIYAENMTFIGGPMPHGNAWTGNRTTTRKGDLLGMSLNNTDYPRFMRNLHDLNIEHLVVWSLDSKYLLSAFPNISLVEEFGWFSIYRYDNAPLSFVVRTVGGVWANVTEFGVREIRVLVKANETGMVTLSSSFFPNWHAYADGVRLPVDRDDIFLRISIPPKDEPYEVSVVFEETPIETYSKWASVIAWITVVGFLVFNAVFEFVKRHGRRLR